MLINSYKKLEDFLKIENLSRGAPNNDGWKLVIHSFEWSKYEEYHISIIYYWLINYKKEGKKKYEIMIMQWGSRLAKVIKENTKDKVLEQIKSKMNEVGFKDRENTTLETKSLSLEENK